MKAINAYISDPRITCNSKEYPVWYVDYSTAPLLCGIVGFDVFGLSIKAELRQMLAPPFGMDVLVNLFEMKRTVYIPKKETPVLEVSKLGCSLLLQVDPTQGVPLLTVKMHGDVCK